MTEMLTAEGYEQTMEKLRDLETRLTALEHRTDLSVEHLASVRRSYKVMMREFQRDIKLYETKQNKQISVTTVPGADLNQALQN